MAVQFTMREARAKLSELVRRAESGEEVEIKRRGKPALILRPISASQPQPPLDRDATKAG